MKEIEEIKARIENYKTEFKLNEATAPLILIAEILVEISISLRGVANKMWE